MDEQPGVNKRGSNHRLFQKKKRRRGNKDAEPCVLAPLATEDPVDQLDGVQEENEEEDDDEEMMRISPRSDSPRGWLVSS